MKTYKYSKLAFAIQCVAVVLLIGGLLAFELYTNDFKFSVTFWGLVIFAIICFPFLISIGKRKITTDDNSICFYSFFNSIYTSKEERNFKVNFSGISRIDFKKTFLSKKITLKIKVSSRSNFVFIEPFMNNHIELYKEICENVMKNNPDAYISPTVLRYCDQSATTE